jgi:hypothetical protein
VPGGTEQRRARSKLDVANPDVRISESEVRGTHRYNRTIPLREPTRPLYCPARICSILHFSRVVHGREYYDSTGSGSVAASFACKENW